MKTSNVYESVKGAYVITPETMKGAKQDMVLMHPLPRVGEISMDVDNDPRAAYFRQMEYGLYVAHGAAGDGAWERRKTVTHEPLFTGEHDTCARLGRGGERHGHELL